MDKRTLGKLNGLVLGQGTERTCILSPDEENCVVKLSPRGRAKQTRRESKYFRFLQKKGVPFLYIPVFMGDVQTDACVGFKQEAVLDDDGKSSPCLWEIIKKDSPRKQAVPALLRDLYQYLMRYNILPCDLHPGNILVQNRGGHVRLVLIDGLGSMNLLPVCQYIPWLGRKQIRRKWQRFIKRDIGPYFSEEKLLF